ncbi:hypothetical protein ES702_05748 [subsurface metagenome]
MAYGDIGAVIDTYEFDTTGATNSHIIHIDGDVYAIAYCDAGSQCRLKTVEIAANGQITDPYIDDLVVHATRGTAPAIQWVSGNIYAIASRDGSFRPMLSTVEITPAGQIGAAVIDSWAWATVSETWHAWSKRTATILALAFQGDGHDGWIYTIQIDVDGNITKSVDYSLEFDPSGAQPGKMAEVGPGIYAIAHLGPGDDGIIRTFSQSITGQLSAAVIDSLIFESVYGWLIWLIQVHPGIYAIPYQGPGNHGKICTVAVADDGDIGAAIIDSMEFDSTFCGKPNSISCGGDTVAVVYQGPGNDGWLATLEIDDSGAITDPPLATFEFDPGNGLEPSIIRITGDVYAIAYTGVDSDGFLKTVTIESPPEVGPDHSLMMGIGP